MVPQLGGGGDKERIFQKKQMAIRTVNLFQAEMYTKTCKHGFDCMKGLRAGQGDLSRGADQGDRRTGDPAARHRRVCSVLPRALNLHAPTIPPHSKGSEQHPFLAKPLTPPRNMFPGAGMGPPWETRVFLPLAPQPVAELELESHLLLIPNTMHVTLALKGPSLPCGVAPLQSRSVLSALHRTPFNCIPTAAEHHAPGTPANQKHARVLIAVEDNRRAVIWPKEFQVYAAALSRK